jgi:hypothetical protein
MQDKTQNGSGRMASPSAVVPLWRDKKPNVQSPNSNVGRERPFPMVGAGSGRGMYKRHDISANFHSGFGFQTSPVKAGFTIHNICNVIFGGEAQKITKVTVITEIAICFHVMIWSSQAHIR